MLETIKNLFRRIKQKLRPTYERLLDEPPKPMIDKTKTSTHSRFQFGEDIVTSQIRKSSGGGLATTSAGITRVTGTIDAGPVGWTTWRVWQVLGNVTYKAFLGMGLLVAALPMICISIVAGLLSLVKVFNKNSVDSLGEVLRNCENECGEEYLEDNGQIKNDRKTELEIELNKRLKNREHNYFYNIEIVNKEKTGVKVFFKKQFCKMTGKEYSATYTPEIKFKLSKPLADILSGKESTRIKKTKAEKINPKKSGFSSFSFKKLFRLSSKNAQAEEKNAKAESEFKSFKDFTFSDLFQELFTDYSETVAIDTDPLVTASNYFLAKLGMKKEKLIEDLKKQLRLEVYTNLVKEKDQDYDVRDKSLAEIQQYLFTKQAEQIRKTNGRLDETLLKNEIDSIKKDVETKLDNSTADESFLFKAVLNTVTDEIRKYRFQDKDSEWEKKAKTEDMERIMAFAKFAPIFFNDQGLDPEATILSRRRAFLVQMNSLSFSKIVGGVFDTFNDSAFGFWIVFELLNIIFRTPDTRNWPIWAVVATLVGGLAYGFALLGIKVARAVKSAADTMRGLEKQTSSVEFEYECRPQLTMHHLLESIFIKDLAKSIEEAAKKGQNYQPTTELRHNVKAALNQTFEKLKETKLPAKSRGARFRTWFFSEVNSVQDYIDLLEKQIGSKTDKAVAAKDIASHGIAFAFIFGWVIPVGIWCATQLAKAGKLAYKLGVVFNEGLSGALVTIGSFFLGALVGSLYFTQHSRDQRKVFREALGDAFEKVKPEIMRVLLLEAQNNKLRELLRNAGLVPDESINSYDERPFRKMTAEETPIYTGAKKTWNRLEIGVLRGGSGVLIARLTILQGIPLLAGVSYFMNVPVLSYIIGGFAAVASAGTFVPVVAGIILAIGLVWSAFNLYTYIEGKREEAAVKFLADLPNRIQNEQKKQKRFLRQLGCENLIPGKFSEEYKVEKDETFGHELDVNKDVRKEIIDKVNSQKTLIDSVKKVFSGAVSAPEGNSVYSTPTASTASSSASSSGSEDTTKDEDKQPLIDKRQRTGTNGKDKTNGHSKTNGGGLIPLDNHKSPQLLAGKQGFWQKGECILARPEELSAGGPSETPTNGYTNGYAHGIN